MKRKDSRLMVMCGAVALILPLSILLPQVSICLGDIYKYQDEKGVWHITNAPADVPGGTKLEKTGYEDRLNHPGDDLVLQLSKHFSPRNEVEKARNATVAIQSPKGLGSGFFITEEGYILTSRHILGDGYRCKINLVDGTELFVNVVKRSDHYDLALLELHNYKCPFIEPMDAFRIPDGAPVYAIGSPIGLMHSASSGIVSGIRKFGNTYYIQTNAQINPGNSGGPLISQDGKVIGINTWKVVDVASEGLGFAIPINLAIEEFETLLGRHLKLK